MPISSLSIKRNLNCIQKRYDNAMASKDAYSSLEAQLCSKLAIIELCGWIEETIDTILMDYLRRTIPNHTIRSAIEKDIIQNVYGFKYNQYRQLMERILGARRFEHIVMSLERVKARNSHLHSILSDLSKKRNLAAHTHFEQGVTQTFDAPSCTLQCFNKIFPIFKSIERMVNNMK